MRTRARRIAKALGGVTVCLALQPLAGIGSESFLGNFHGVCTFEPSSGELTVTTDTGDAIDVIKISRPAPGAAESQGIVLQETTFPSDPSLGPTRTRELACAEEGTGAAFVPTVGNVDTITVVLSRFLTLDLQNGDLAPGATPEEDAASPEIEVAYEPLPGDLRASGVLIRVPATGPIHHRLGAVGEGTGVNLNPTQDASDGDVDVFGVGISEVMIEGSGGDDVIDAGGGTEFSGPLTAELEASVGAGSDTVQAGAGNATVHGDDGNDALVGGSGMDRLQDGRGNDFVSGGLGNDSLSSDRGDDVVDAGGGVDWVYFFSVRGRVAADLRIPGPQDTGAAGTDTYAGVENLHGGSGRSLLIGDEGPNRITAGTGRARLVGNGGDDLLEGQGGADRLIGGLGVDVFRGGYGRDRLYARDGAEDVALRCGKPGRITELVRRDPVDPAPVGCD